VSGTAVAAIAVAALATSALSSVFGMAGGMILMGALAWVAPVQQAMMLHGATQAAANGWRAVLNRRAIQWRSVGWFSAGALGALAAVSAAQIAPDRVAVYLSLGALPFAARAIPARFAPDAGRKGDALACGAAVTAIQFVAGVAGPLLDLFFVRTPLGRHEVVATKAATQWGGHLAKLAYYGVLLRRPAAGGAVPVEVLALSIGCAVAGTWAGKAALDRLSDAAFRRWTGRLVLLIGAAMIGRGVHLWLAGP